MCCKKTARLNRGTGPSYHHDYTHELVVSRGISPCKYPHPIRTTLNAQPSTGGKRASYGKGVRPEVSYVTLHH